MATTPSPLKKSPGPIKLATTPIKRSYPSARVTEGEKLSTEPAARLNLRECVAELNSRMHYFEQVIEETAQRTSSIRHPDSVLTLDPVTPILSDSVQVSSNLVDDLSSVIDRARNLSLALNSLNSDMET